MVLANYCKIFRSVMSNVNGQAINGSFNQMSSANSGYTQAVKAMSGGDNTTISYKAVNGGKVWIDVGFGDTPETPDDYKLADPNAATSGTQWGSSILTGLSGTKLEASDREFFNITQIFRNDTNANVTVKEVGVLGNPCNSNGIAYTMLLCRKVLDTPLVIAPGESYVFNYRLRIKDS